MFKNKFWSISNPVTLIKCSKSHFPSSDFLITRDKRFLSRWHMKVGKISDQCWVSCTKLCFAHVCREWKYTHPLRKVIKLLHLSHLDTFKHKSMNKQINSFQQILWKNYIRNWTKYNTPLSITRWCSWQQKNKQKPTKTNQNQPWSSVCYCPDLNAGGWRSGPKDSKNI